MTRPHALIVAGLLTLLGAAPLLADDREIADQLQGEWAHTQTGPDGSTVRIVKHFDGRDETYSTYRSGELVYSHVVKGYRVRPIDPDQRLYAYSVDGFEVTAGASKGQKMSRKVEVLFCLKGKRFIEMGGVLKDDPRQPSMMIFERVEVEPSQK